MFRLRPTRIHLYLFGVLLLGFLFTSSYVFIGKPKQASAWPGGPYPTCTISMSGSGTQQNRSFTMSVDWHGTLLTWQGQAPGGAEWGYPLAAPAHNIPFPGSTVWSDTFSIGSHTVTGSYAFQTFATGTAPNEIDCSLSFTVADPNHPATGSVSGSCNAAGQLYVSVSVSDPDGGTPGYSIHIDNIADLPVSWGGSTTLGPYSPARDGVNHSIWINVVDPQTGGVFGPFNSTYNCPVPTNSPSGSVSGSCNAAGQLYVSVSVSDPDGGTPGYSIHIDNIADLPVSWGGSTTLGPYSPPRDGVTYGIFIYVADPQTGGIYGPFSGTYNCPVASNPTPTNPPTCNLTVNPSTVDPGGSATLFWSTTDANYFQINQGIGPQAQVSGGSVTIFPGNVSKTYIGSVYGPLGSAACGVTITVRTISCSINTIDDLEPGQSFTPSVTLTYIGAAASISATTNVYANGSISTNVMPTTSFTGNTTRTVTTAPAITLATAGNNPVQGSVSGKLNGNNYGPLQCNGATNILVVRKPFFKVFNGGATVGSGFNSGTTTCTTSGSGIVSGFASNSPSIHGSGVQYDLRALNSVVTTFYSSGGLPTALPSYKALTFANNAASGTYGGSFGGTSCITDYYTTTKNTIIPTASGAATIASLDAAAGAGNQVEWSGGTLSGGNLAAAGKLVVYVTGDVYISGSIVIASNYTKLTDIPFFALIVKGNIKIAPGVILLDGMYVAQPNGASGGTIYTCLNADNSIPDLYNSCGSRLVFNGFVTAKKIKLLRTGGTLASDNYGGSAGVSNAAEVFNGLPELYFASPAFKLDDSASELYDSITSLPPLL